MNNDHWPVYDQATAEPKYGYNSFAWSAEAADDGPVPYTLTPAAEALLEAEAGARHRRTTVAQTGRSPFGDPASPTGQVIDHPRKPAARATGTPKAPGVQTTSRSRMTEDPQAHFRATRGRATLAGSPRSAGPDEWLLNRAGRRTGRA